MFAHVAAALDAAGLAPEPYRAAVSSGPQGLKAWFPLAAGPGSRPVAFAAALALMDEAPDLVFAAVPAQASGAGWGVLALVLRNDLEG